MPALVKVTPVQLKDILLQAGWRVHQEDPLNWSLVKGNQSLELPKKGKLVSFEVMYHALTVAELALRTYLELREKVLVQPIPPPRQSPSADPPNNIPHHVCCGGL